MLALTSFAASPSGPLALATDGSAHAASGSTQLCETEEAPRAELGRQPATSRTSSRPSRGRERSEPGGEGARLGLQQPLHHDDVEPAAELAANFSFRADDREPGALVQGDRCL